jgi:CDP-paratose 2-epimerase
VLPGRILVTGGAGFVGANLCLALAERHPGAEVVALDSLKRRGSELNLPRLRAAGVEFVHGDVRERDDLLAIDPVGAIVECSAEPSVLAGIDSGTDFLVHTNLMGAYNCLELARRQGAQLVFLSTSRVYPVAALGALAYAPAETRFELDEHQPLAGASARGISEDFPLEGARTLYGATKLAAELLIAEYAETFGLRAVVDRCGVIAGPWQMGKVDQGVFTHWMLAHYLGRDLSYIGYGGEGRQVRDMLHVEDLVGLVEDQLARPDHWAGVTANVGGGRDCSLSLLEATAICRELTGNHVDIGAEPENRPGDVPLYLSDCGRLSRHTDWRPTHGARRIMEDTFDWIHDNEATVVAALS